MDGLLDKNNEQGQFTASDSLATAPPPPPEVKIRTMRSDVESMAKTGGGLPQFQNVKVSGLSEEKPAASATVKTESKSNILLIALLIVVVAALIVVGWFAYEKFFAGNASAPVVQTTAPTSSAPQTPANAVVVPTTTPIVALPAPTVVSAHVSFFKPPADQTLSWSLASATTTQPKTYNQRLLALLGTAKKTSNLLEIDATDSSGNSASVNELLTAANAQVIDPQVLAENFNPDATFFVYRDANGFWPGYIIALDPTQNWLAVQSSVQQVEASAAIANLFLMNVGTASPDSFTDTMVASSSVRVLPFFGGTVPGYFTYGWTPDHQYLILSTSQSGFAAALSRL